MSLDDDEKLVIKHGLVLAQKFSKAIEECLEACRKDDCKTIHFASAVLGSLTSIQSQFDSFLSEKMGLPKDAIQGAKVIAKLTADKWLEEHVKPNFSETLQ